MKRFIISLFISLVAALSITVPALAFEQWEIKMSEPRATQQLRTFNIEFTTLSVSADDQITVRLKQADSTVDTKMTTKPYGDSGAFTITVPADGTYTYSLEADSSAFEETKTAGPVTVTVTTPTDTTISVVSTTAGRGANTASSNGGQTSGQVNGSNKQQGTVGEESASTEKSDEGKDVLGAEDNKDQNGWSDFAIYLAIIVAIIALYVFFYGEDKAAALVKRLLRR